MLVSPLAEAEESFRNENHIFISLKAIYPTILGVQKQFS